MAKITPRRLAKLMKTFGLEGLAPDNAKKILAEDSEFAAEVVRNSLEKILTQIQADSQSGALNGYEAVKILRSSFTGVLVAAKLRRSGIDISGDYEWIVTVKPSPHHINFGEYGLNVFDILDTGREAMPKRGAGEPPYPLWGVAESGAPTRISDTRQKRKGQFTVAQPRAAQGATRKEPRQLGGPIEPGIIFSRGPLAAVPAKNLYARALQQAKSDLQVKGLAINWDVIFGKGILPSVWRTKGSTL